MRYRWNETRLAPLPAEPEQHAAGNGDEQGAQPLRPALGGLLIEAGLVSAEQIRDALAEGLTTGERLGEVIVRRGWASEERVAQLLAQQWELRFRKAETISIDSMAIRRLKQADARRLRAVPVWFDDGGLVLAIEEPTTELFAAVKEMLGEVSYVVVARSTLDHLLSSRFLTDDVSPPLVPERALAAVEEEREDNPDDAQMVEPEVATDAEERSLDSEQLFEEAHPWSAQDEQTSDEPEPDDEGFAASDQPADVGSAASDAPTDAASDAQPDDGSAASYEPSVEGSVAIDEPEAAATESNGFPAGLEDDRPGGGGDIEISAGEPDLQDESDLDGPSFPGAGATDERDSINDDSPPEHGADDWGNDVVTIESDVEMDTVRGAADEVGSVLHSIEEASSGLRSIEREVTSLGDALRQAREQLAVREAELAEVNEAKRRDADTIQRLESELGRRNDLLGALKTKVAEFTQAFDAADS